MSLGQTMRFSSVYVARAANAPAPNRIRTCAASLLRSRSMTTATQPILWRQQPIAKGGIVAGQQGMRNFHSSPIRRIESAAVAGEPASSTLASAAAQLDPAVATHAAMQIGDLAKYGLDTYLPTRLAEYALEFMYVTTGLPWWATIVLMVVAVRASMFPLALWSQKHQVAVNQVAPDLKLLTERQKTAAMAGDTVTSMRIMQEVQSFHKKHDTHPGYAAMGNLANLPYMLFMFFGLRDLAKLPFTGMNTGGLLWFTDLASADPTYILPVLSGLGMVATMELQSRLNAAVPVSKEMRWGMRVAGLSMVFFVSNLPTCVFVFWMANNVFSLGQILLFNSKTFCRLAGIPTIKPIKFARAPESMLSKIDLKALITGKKSKPAPKYVKGRRV